MIGLVTKNMLTKQSIQTVMSLVTMNMLTKQSIQTVM